MNWILKNKKKNSKALFVVLFLAGVFVFFGNIKNADASCECQLTKEDGTPFGSPATKNTGPTETDCSTTCLSWGGANNKASYSWNGSAFKSATAPSAATSLAASAGTGSLKTGNVNKMATTNVADTCQAGMFECAIRALLVGVFNLVGWLFGVAATLFAWVVDPANISAPSTGMLQKQAVKDVWIMVRDLLNMTFILILLFAAFCTIFQVDKWNLKKVWLNILINALLVNFSYPIARFFIDVSNVAFYYFLNNMFSATGTSTVTGSSIFAMFGNASSLGKLLMPNGYSTYPTAYLLASIVFVFILGMTLLIVAALFVVRLVALTMLVMFSPVGFVGYIFPSTAGYADKWWTNLFSYSFFAPVMIFIMAISLRIMEVLGKENMASFVSNANANAPADQANWIAKAAFFMIPIIILWMGIGLAKSAGGLGAASIVSSVKNGGKWLANAPGHYSGVYGGTKKGWESMRKSGSFLGMNNGLTSLAFKSGVADREAKFGGAMSGGIDGYKDAKRDLARKAANEIRENWKKAGGASNSELESALKGGQAQKMAAALEMSEKNGFKLNDNDTPKQVLERYQNAARALTSDKVLQNNFNDKVKEKHIKLVIQNDIANNPNKAVADVYKEHLDKLTATKLAGQKGLTDADAVKETVSYLKGRQTTGNRTDVKFVSTVIGNLSSADRNALHAHNTAHNAGLHM